MTYPILITGAAGFIGYHMAARLLADGHQVVGLDNLNDYYDPSLKQARLDQLAPNPGFRFVRMDLGEDAGLSDLMRDLKPQWVVHLAAQAGVRYSLTHPHAYAQSNLVGFLNILEACRATPPQHLLYASSSSVYGGNTKMPFHEDDPVNHPISLYAASKRANELMAHTYAHLYGLPASGLRFFTVYGPWGRPDMAYFKFVKAAFEGTPIEVFGHGQQKRDFTYIDDIIEGMVRLLAKPPASDDGRAPHQVYNIGRHDPEDLMEFIATIERLTGRTLAKTMRPMQPGDVPATYADVSRLTAQTGFAPVVPLAQGLERFIAWYRSYYGIAA
jgi:UDP-glucuronate 4-epimerase